ncbi:MAG: hypothetical protein AB8G99_19785 [Planctomycetaceae bacterium]
MHSNDDNPYAPPMDLEDDLDVPPRDSRRSTLLVILTLVATVGMVSFATSLMTSTRGDRMIGYLFFLNAVPLIGLALAEYRTARTGPRYGAAATAIQAAIMGSLLSFPGTKKSAVIVIFLVTVIPMSALTFWSWRVNKRRLW